MQIQSSPSVRRDRMPFASAIHIVDAGAYRAKAANALCNDKLVTRSWTPDDRVILQPEGATEVAAVCNVLGLVAVKTADNPGKVTLLHINPLHYFNSKTRFDFSFIGPVLRGEIDRIKALRQPVRAFLAAGDNFPYQSHAKDGKTKTVSRSLGNYLLQHLLDAKIPASIIWGQATKGHVDVHYAEASDTWTVHANSFVHPDRDVLNETHLKDAFDTISIAPGDTLAVNGKPVPSARVHQWQHDGLKPLALRSPTRPKRKKL